MNWKIIAIIFIILFTIETLWISYGLYLIQKEEAQVNECYYNICSDYPEAQVQNNVCFCYELDLLGEYVIAKTEVIK